MLWWNTTYKNETLEKIFTDKNNYLYYKIYDTYYEKKAKENLIKKTTSLDINTIFLDDIKLNIKTDHLSTFKEHYNNFKPTLDQIKNFDSNQLNKVSEMQSFIKSDLNNLFSRPYKEDIRHEYLSKIQENFDKIPDILDYRKILTKVEYKAQNLAQAQDYFVDPNNTKVIQDAFATSRCYSNAIMSHPDLPTIVDIVSRQLDNLTYEQLNILTDIITNYEKFALVTFEPYLVSLIGIKLFFKVFVPLHKSGAFSTFMANVIKKQYDMRNNFVGRVNLASEWISKVTKAIQPGVISLSNLVGKVYTTSALLNGVSLFISNYMYNSQFNNKTPTITNEPHNVENSIIVTNTANKIIEETRVLENPFIDKMSTGGKTIGFLIGRVSKSVTRGIVLGLGLSNLEKNEETLISLAKKADEFIDQQSKK